MFAVAMLLKNPCRRLAGALLLLLPLLLAACGGGDADPPEPVARASAVIGAAGGTVTGPDGVQVIVPPGALRADTPIGIARSADGAPGRDASWAAAGATYEFTPHGIAFELPVTLRLPVPAGTVDPTVWMAGTDADWQQNEATIAGGFASVQRNTFSWGGVYGGCSIPANAPPNPDRCFSPSGDTRVVASPSGALTLTSHSNAYINGAGTFRLDAAATLSFTATYNLWPSCSHARLRLHRRQLDKSPQLLETLFDQTVGLQQNFFPDGRRGSGGATAYPPMALSHLDAGRHVYSTYISCQRADGLVTTYTDSIVIHVAVPVPTSTQTIGGTVSGLSGTVVLRNNGADDLSVGADGPFTFAAPVATGAPFHITVATQPAGQTCAVHNGSGTASANVTNVAVSCAASPAGGTWLGMNRIDASPGAAYQPVVAIDGNGNGLAVWIQDSGPQAEVWANRYAAGSGGWGTPQRIDSGSSNAEHPVIAMDAAGNATALWTQHDGTAPSIRAASHTAGGGWSADVAVESGSGPAHSAHLGIDASGNVLAVWTQDDLGANQSRIMANRRVNGVWQGETAIDGAVGAVAAPQVAVFPDGTALVVWLQDQGGTLHVFHNRFNGTGWSTADQLHPSTAPTGGLRIAGGSAGEAIAVWAQSPGAGSSTADIVAARYAGGLWTTPVTLSNIHAQQSEDPRIAMTANGQARVVWREWRTGGGAFETWANRYEPGSGWGAAAVRLDAALAGNSSNNSAAAIGVDAGGNAIVLWNHTPGAAPHDGLYTSRYDASGLQWGPPQRIEDAGHVALAVNAGGHAIAVWDDSVNGIRANAFSP